MIVWNGFTLIALAIVAIICLCVGIRKGIERFLEWRKSGYCRHNFELHRTNSFGQHHWYRCTKCNTERLK